MKVVIFGGAGYIGSLLTSECLDRDYDVVVIDNLMYNQGPLMLYLAQHEQDNFRFIKHDVCDLSSIRSEITSADVIVNLAAIVGAPLCEKYKAKATQLNHKMVEELVAMLSPHQRLIYPNTNSGYGTVRDQLCTEDTPLKPISHYGVTKLGGELAALEHDNSIVLRLATLFGISPRMRFDVLVNRYVYDAHFDHKISVYDSTLNRNFVHVRDVVNAMLFFMNADHTQHRVYNVGLDSANTSKLSLAKLVSEYVPSEVVVVDDQTCPDKRDYLVSSSRLYAEGFDPEFSLVHGIREVRKYLDFLSSSDKDGLLASMHNFESTTF